MVQDLSVVGHGRRAGAQKERVLVLTQNEFNRYLLFTGESSERILTEK